MSCTFDQVKTKHVTSNLHTIGVTKATVLGNTHAALPDTEGACFRRQLWHPATALTLSAQSSAVENLLASVLSGAGWALYDDRFLSGTPSFPLEPCLPRVSSPAQECHSASTEHALLVFELGQHGERAGLGVLTRMVHRRAPYKFLLTHLRSCSLILYRVVTQILTTLMNGKITHF